MSNQQIRDDMIQLSELVFPSNLFDDEPIIIIYDLNEYIVNYEIDLKPFNNIITIINDENILNNKLRNFNKSFIIIFILPQYNNNQIQTFINNNNIITNQSIKYFYLFFINGKNQNQNLRLIFNNRLIQSYSITSQIISQTHSACAKGNDDYINYCESNRIKNEILGNIGIANSYTLQKLNRLRIQSEYNQLILIQIQQRI